MKIIRFIWFLFSEVMWGGLKFFLEIPSAIWKKFQEKERIKDECIHGNKIDNCGNCEIENGY